MGVHGLLSFVRPFLFWDATITAEQRVDKTTKSSQNMEDVMGLCSTSKKRARLPFVYISSHRVIISFIFKTTTRYCTFILHVCRKKVEVEAQVLAPESDELGGSFQ